MSDKIQMSEDLRRLARLLRAIPEAADVIGAVGTMEQAQAEATKRMEAARADEAVAVAGAEKARADLDAAAAIATKTVKGAEADAAALIAKAHEDIAAMKDAAEKSLESIKTKERRAESDQRKAEKALSDALAAVDAAKAEEAAVRIRIEKIKADAKAALG